MKRLFIFLCILSSSLFSQIPDATLINIGSHKLSVHLSHDINLIQEKIERAIITIHGSTRNGDTYYKSVSRMAKRLGVQDTTLVLSPNFKESGDFSNPGELIYRPWQDWWIGNNSIARGDDSSSVSSFSVIDRLVEIFSDRERFPHLDTLVIAGHSAGGHLTQRYALGSRAEDSTHLNIKYVVANPGTYAYLNNKRPIGFFGRFKVPRNPRCYYNHYKYGLDKKNEYMSRDDNQTMIERYLKRNVVYLLGDQDLGDVEQSCEAALQGATRFARGKFFKAHLDEFFPSNDHQLIIVPDVGHTQYGMYTSEIGSEVLFY
jgi:pimeloyl-ACP methyl ester carboxylesterase